MSSPPPKPSLKFCVVGQTSGKQQSAIDYNSRGKEKTKRNRAAAATVAGVPSTHQCRSRPVHEDVAVQLGLRGHGLEPQRGLLLPEPDLARDVVQHPARRVHTRRLREHKIA